MKKITNKFFVSLFAVALMVVGAVGLTGCSKKEMVDISIDTSNTKIVYLEGETLSTAGLVVNKVFGNGSKERTQDYILNDSDFISDTQGEYRIEISVGEYSKAYIVTVYPKDAKTLLSVARNNAGEIYNFATYGRGTIITSDGYYVSTVSGEYWAMADGKYREKGSSSYHPNKSEKYDTFNEAYEQAYGVVDRDAGFETPLELIQYIYYNSLTLDGYNQTIDDAEYTRTGNANNGIHISLCYTYDTTDGVGTRSFSLDLQQINGKLIATKCGGYEFNVDGLQLPELPF